MFSAHHGETRNVRAHSKMGKAIRGKWENNSQSAQASLLSHLYMLVDLLFHREKSVTVSASDCFSTSLELTRKSEGWLVDFYLFQLSQKPTHSSFCHQNSKFCLGMQLISFRRLLSYNSLSATELPSSAECWRAVKWFLMVSLKL